MTTTRLAGPVIFGFVVALGAASSLASCSDGGAFGSAPVLSWSNGRLTADGGPAPNPTCQHPAPGCACAQDGEQMACGQVDTTVGQQHVCGTGLSICSAGTWGECIINNTVTLIPEHHDEGPGAVPQALHGATACLANPCDPFCNDFLDDPSGLSNADAGIAAQDGGLTLVNPVSGPPPATLCAGGTLGTCSHSICGSGPSLSTGCDGSLACVQKVCASRGSCCGTTWDGTCVALAQSLCNVACGSQNGVCVVCYKDSIDHDGDGYSWAQGDCADCDPSINPGAYDYPGNGIDEDCSGTADDAPVICDGSLPLASSQAGDYAKAMDLCQTTTAGAVGAAKTWGVISSHVVQADGSSAPNPSSYGILSQFGPNNLPQKGSRMAAFSSGTARSPSDPGWFNPNGQSSPQQGFNAGTSCAYPSGFPKNKAGCANAVGLANDSAGVLMNIRVPTNASSFTYRFNFFTSEYPEYVCNAYNDSYVALLKSSFLPANAPTNSGNISFDTLKSPVNVNNGFFTVVGGPQLSGTGFDGLCRDPSPPYALQPCGGATGWLETSAPVVPGETIQIQLSIWDASDHLWDSLVLVDDWTWSGKPATIQTTPPPPPPVALYSAGSFARDYDATGVCPVGYGPVWGLWSWNSQTPGSSSISFTVQTADTLANVAAAPVDALQFSNPPGPVALAGKPAVAATGTPNTNAGAAAVDATLMANNRVRNLNVVRITSQLTPSSDKLSAPVLSAWDLQFDCQAID